MDTRMKKNKVLSLLFCSLLLISALTLSSFAADAVSTEKDGLKATFSLTPSDVEGEAFCGELTVTNGCAYAQDFRVSFSLPDGVVIRTGDLNPVFSLNAETNLTYTFGDPLPAEPEPVAKKGCFSSVGDGALLVLALAALAAASLTTSNTSATSRFRATSMPN